MVTSNIIETRNATVEVLRKYISMNPKSELVPKLRTLSDKMNLKPSLRLLIHEKLSYTQISNRFVSNSVRKYIIIGINSVHGKLRRDIIRAVLKVLD